MKTASHDCIRLYKNKKLKIKALNHFMHDLKELNNTDLVSCKGR